MSSEVYFICVYIFNTKIQSLYGLPLVHLENERHFSSMFQKNPQNKYGNKC